MIAILILAAAPAARPAQPALAPFATFAGHCWRGEAPGQGVDTHCFEWVYGGQHLRDRHVVTQNGKPVYEGESLYSVERGKVSFTYWNSLGGLGRGIASSVGDELRFSGMIHATATSAEQPMTAVWKQVPGGYEVQEGADGSRTLKRVD
jgi:hypothetical protein